MKKIVMEIIAFALTLTLLISACAYLGDLYMPQRLDSGATWNMYLKEPENSIDLLFVGSSLAYCDIIPAQIYKQTGHTSYVLAAPYMKPDVAYYYLKEALRTQRPGVVMLEASSFFFADSEADFYKVNIGYMPWGANRLAATFAAPEQYRLGLLFPLYNYHDRWQNTHPAEYFTGRTDRLVDPLAGYSLLDTCVPQDERFERKFAASEEERTENFAYLQKIKALCDEKGITLKLFVVPACEYMGTEDVARLRREAADIPVVDFNEEFGLMGLDPATDFFDSRHVNISGAKKFSNHLASYINEKLTLPQNSHDSQLWQDRVAKSDELKLKS